MRDGLYRVEVLAGHNIPEVKCMAMVMTNEGLAYANFHPVKLTAQTKPKGKSEYIMYAYYPGVADEDTFFAAIMKKIMEGWKPYKWSFEPATDTDMACFAVTMMREV